MRTLFILMALMWILPARADAVVPSWASQVLKIVVTRQDGGMEYGSAVPLAGERLVTNCHVLRDAARIEVHDRETVRLAHADRRDVYRDLCFLTVPGFSAEPMPMVAVGETRVGLEVRAVGHSGGHFAVSEGKVVGLHECECDGGRVIQTSAPFERGASGGGLFDRQGRLVGILTFKSKSGGNFHFALPVGWLRHMAEQGIEPIVSGNSFWERPGRESAYFLAACDLGAKQDWRGLGRLAQEWSEQEPHNPEAWMALGRARMGMGKGEAAATAFQQVLMLDSTYDEAKWRLGELELELGRSLAVEGGM